MRYDFTVEARISIPSTKSIRFGPAGLKGTVAMFNVVKAGVFSCRRTFVACNWVSIAVRVFCLMESSFSNLSRSLWKLCRMIF